MAAITNPRNDIAVWVERLQRNEPHAFEGLYQKCSGYVSFVCSKFCDSKEDVEEIVQDTFVILHKKVNELRGDTVLAYLHKIAVNECFRRRKANHRRATHINLTDEMPDNIHELDKSLLPEDALLNKEWQTQLLIYISQLSKNQREAVYLYYYLDFTAHQIAALMECTVDNVYLNLSRARKAIKRKLEERRPTVVAAHAIVLLPLAALFLAEEATYVAAYVPITLGTAAIATTSTAAATGTASATAATGSIATYVAAACATLILGTAITLYINLQPEQEILTTYDTIPVITQPTPQPTTPAQAPTIVDLRNYEENPNEEPTNEEFDFDEPATEAPEPTTSEPIQPEQTPAPTTAPVPTLPPQPPTPAPTQPATEYPVSQQAPQDIPLDRTQYVLAALAHAHTPAQLQQILDTFNFDTDIEITTQADIQLTFHRFNEGSGDVLVGTSVYADGTGWFMQYKFHEGGYATHDSFELFRWMRG